MSQDIEIDPDSRTITYYEKPTMNLDLEDIKSRALYQQGGPNPAQVLIHESDFNYLLVEINRLRRDCEHHKQAALDISDENDRLRKLVPPESERGPGFVGQGSWSVFAEKVVAERDELRIEVQNLRAWAEVAEKVVEERDAAREGMKQLLAEKIELRDELSGLCEEIRYLKEENDELKETVRLLGAQLAAKKEHTSIDTNGDEPLEISGYGKFKLMRTTADSQWMLFLNKENIMLYNRNGKRVRAKFTEW